MTVIYLDIDDEITSAAARIRTAADVQVALVLPAGSRVATSRINFRLLAREAGLRGRRLAVVAPDTTARSLASAAGLPVFATVHDYDAAIENGLPGTGTGGPLGPGGPFGSGGPGGSSAAGGSEGPGRGGPRAGAGPLRGPGSPPDSHGPGGSGGFWSEDFEEPSEGEPDVPSVRSQLRPREAAARRAAAAGTHSVVALPEGEARRRGLRMLAFALIGLFIASLVIAAPAAYLLLPSARIVLTPRVQAVGPLAFTVRADPSVTAVDTTAGLIPATRLTFELSAKGSFPATGKRIEETKATGVAVFQNCDTSRAHTVRAGTTIRTRSGVAFTTNGSVAIAAATVPAPGQINCPSRQIGITAVRAGDSGNVAARSITVLPASLAANVLFVRNPSPTSGGLRKEIKIVSKGDIEAALAALTKEIQEEFAARIADPELAPPGTKVYPETGGLSEPRATSDPAGLIGEALANFELEATANGTVVAVDSSPIRSMADLRVRAGVAVDYALQPDSVIVSTGQPEFEEEIVALPVSAGGSQIRLVDPVAVLALIRGRPLPEAQAALEAFGTASVSLTPDWAPGMPSFDFRIELIVEGQGPRGPTGPSSSPTQGSPSRASPVPSEGDPSASATEDSADPSPAPAGSP